MVKTFPSVKEFFEFLNSWWEEGDHPIHAGALVGDDDETTVKDAVRHIVETMKEKESLNVGDYVVVKYGVPYYAYNKDSKDVFGKVLEISDSFIGQHPVKKYKVCYEYSASGGDNTSVGVYTHRAWFVKPQLEKISSEAIHKMYDEYLEKIQGFKRVKDALVNGCLDDVFGHFDN